MLLCEFLELFSLRTVRPNQPGSLRLHLKAVQYARRPRILISTDSPTTVPRGYEGVT